MSFLTRLSRRWMESQASRITPHFRPLQEEIRYRSGCVQARIDLARTPERDLAEMAFQAYSQFGEDGVIQYLVRAIGPGPKTFVEIGVEDYRESNTRFLAQKDLWRGLIVDIGPEAGAMLREEFLDISRSIDFLQRAVTRENVNEILASMAGEIGLLSIDIDGMDYHVWEAIEAVQPRIVAVEYRSLFGHELPLTVPYSSTFSKASNHYSELAYGASLPALESLGKRKGYALVGTSDGPNAFFVREDCLGSVRPCSSREAWKPLWVREARGADGSYSGQTTDAEKLAVIRDCELVHVESGESRRVSEWFGV